MKIVQIVVDERPRSASRCPATDRFWPGFDEVKNVTCKLTGGVDQMTPREFFAQRCPNCPLEEEREMTDPMVIKFEFVTRDIYFVSRKNGREQGRLRLTEGTWRYKDTSVFYLTALELRAIADKLDQLNRLNDKERRATDEQS
jgi:hypothetical protein